MDTKNQNIQWRLGRRGALKLMGLGLGAGVLAACGPQATQAPAPTQAPVEPTAEAVKNVVLRYQNHWSKETDAHYKGMNWLYDAFHAEYPNITIENILNPDSTESYKKITADCAAGDCPDIIHGPGPEMWAAGYLLDLTPHLDAAWMDQLLVSTLYATDGHYWGLDGEFSPMSTIWNTRILEAAGVSAVPKTWDEMLAACEKIKASGKMPTSWGVGGSHQFHNLIASQAGGLEALANNQFDAPQVLEAFTQLKTFVDNKWIPDNEIELTWQESVGMFVSESTAFYLNGAWTLGNEVRSEGAAPDLRDNVEFAPFPSFGENGTTVELKKTTSIGVAAEVGNDPDKLDAAIKFLKFWFSPEGGKQWILLTQSPMGVKVDLSSIEGVDPLLISFLGTTETADNVYGLPETQAMQERGWDDCWTGLQTLMSGGSADDALAAYVTEMSKYTT
jgi:ABC-type glycerol-3-phosphate transport system substrate-binding protein